MSEIRESKVNAEIFVKSRKSGKVTCHKGRYGLYYECVALCRAKDYDLLCYTALA